MIILQRPPHELKSTNLQFAPPVGRGALAVRVAVNPEFEPEHDCVHVDGWRTVARYVNSKLADALAYARDLSRHNPAPIEVCELTSKNNRRVLRYRRYINGREES
jgi:hypothetical protein